MIATKPQLGAFPTPEQGESPERFAIRAHQQLIRSVPEPDERNRIVWKLWEKANGATKEQKIAQRIFDREKYVPAPRICYFAEHQAVDSQGQLRDYDAKELARIVRSCNYRIRDYDAFPPISDGHTPEPDEFRPEPDILGYAGPYWLGMIGREDPRWAIFADEWHLKGDGAARLAKKPRRSVEIWTFANDPTKTHFDPIAAIGSETPRLPIPQRFSLRHHRDGVTVERYTFAASPGGGNTFVQTHQGGKSRPQPKYERTDDMADNQMVAEVLQAIQSTPEFQFLRQMMQQEGAGDDGGAPPNAGGSQQYGADEFDDDMPGDTPDNMGDDDDVADLSDLLVGDDEEDEQPQRMMGGKNCYTRSRGTNGNGKPETLAQKYSRLQRSHNSAVRELGRMNAELQVSRRERADAQRTAALVELAQDFPGCVDVDEELQAVCYSRGAKMSDEQFQAHLATVEKYARRTQQARLEGAPAIPLGRVDRGNGRERSEKYQAKLTKRTVDIYTRETNRGNTDFTYEDARAEAEKELSSAE